jgi:hypothetical protein
MDGIAQRVARRFLAVIRKEKGEYCVRSPNNPDWNGGCYPNKGEAEERLKAVEYFKRQADGSSSMVRVGRGDMTATALSKDIEECLEALVVQNKAHEAGDRSTELRAAHRASRLFFVLPPRDQTIASREARRRGLA